LGGEHEVRLYLAVASGINRQAYKPGFFSSKSSPASEFPPIARRGGSNDTFLKINAFDGAQQPQVPTRHTVTHGLQPSLTTKAPDSPPRSLHLAATFGALCTHLVSDEPTVKKSL
jgi:hypothetical protein